MALSSSFDVSRLDNLETRVGDNEGTMADHATSLGNKLDKTVTAFQDIPAVNVTATNNGLKMTTINANTQWIGGMEDAYTYYWALGKFHANVRDVELRAYMDNLVLRSGRKAGATAGGISLITNDALTAGINSDITITCNTGGQVRANTAFNGTAFNITSDSSFKENIVEWTEKALDHVLGTKVKKYKLKDSGEAEQIGLIRQEAPDVIHAGDTHVNLYAMISVLWKSVQELTEEVRKIRGPEVEDKPL